MIVGSIAVWGDDACWQFQKKTGIWKKIINIFSRRETFCYEVLRRWQSFQDCIPASPLKQTIFELLIILCAKCVLEKWSGWCFFFFSSLRSCRQKGPCSNLFSPEQQPLLTCPTRLRLSSGLLFFQHLCLAWPWDYKGSAEPAAQFPGTT